MSTAMPDDAALRVAAALAGAEVQRIEKLRGGRNSRLFRVKTAKGLYALKLYPSRAEDQPNRFDREVAVLLWMRSQGFTNVPFVVAAAPQDDAVLLSWVDGAAVQNAVGDNEIAQACLFLRRLHALRDTPAVPPECLAVEACLSGRELERQLRARCNALRRLEDPELSEFLDSDAEPALVARLERARAAIAGSAADFSAELSRGVRSPVPSDFGFHNVLRRDDGQLTFLDFEYFGWDDPVKLVADIFLHPGTPLDGVTRVRLLKATTEIYAQGPEFGRRLDAFLPLFALRWAFILLNEFHPERWRDRVSAGARETWSCAKQVQLAAARAMLNRDVTSRRRR